MKSNKLFLVFSLIFVLSLVSSVSAHNLPDLVPVSLDFVSLEEDQLTVSFVVANQDTAQTRDQFNIKFWISGEEPVFFRIPVGLLPGQEYGRVNQKTVTLPINIADESVLINMEVDSDNEIEERHEAYRQESNNLRTFEIFLPTVDRPDLIIRDVTIVSLEGSTLTLDVEVNEQEDSRWRTLAEKDFEAVVEIRYGGNFLRQIVRFSGELTPSGSQTARVVFNIERIAGFQTVNIFVEVDSNYKILETNEDNNTFSVSKELPKERTGSDDPTVNDDNGDDNASDGTEEDKVETLTQEYEDLNKRYLDSKESFLDAIDNKDYADFKRYKNELEDIKDELNDLKVEVKDCLEEFPELEDLLDKITRLRNKVKDLLKEDFSKGSKISVNNTQEQPLEGTVVLETLTFNVDQGLSQPAVKEGETSILELTFLIAGIVILIAIIGFLISVLVKDSSY